MKPLADCRLYTFADTACLHGRTPEIVVQQLCDGGSDLIQLRAKKSTPAEIRRMAETILPITRRANVGLVINDYADIAAGLEAEFCHLGQEDFFDAGHIQVSELRTPGFGSGAAGHISDRVEVERRRANSELRIGLSTHSPVQAKRALAAGADYLAIGPVFATSTKPAARPVTLEYVRWAAANVPIPWFAIGGVTLENLGGVLAAGAQRVCVVSAILNAPDIARACAAFRAQLG